MQDDRLAGSEAQVLDVARAAGVCSFAVKSTCEADWDKVLQLASQHADVHASLGLHPWKVATRSEHWLKTLRGLLEEHPDAGIGECGLDKASAGRGDSEESLNVQEHVFRQQLALAKELARPVTVHCVQAYGRLLAILQELGPFPAKLVLHSWAGSPDISHQLAAIDGVYFSVSGHITRLKPAKARATVAAVPADRLLLETDSPDGLPRLTGEWAEALPGLAEQMVQCKLPAGVHIGGQGGDTQAVHWRSVPLEWYAPIDGSKACSTNGPSVATGDPQQLLNHPANIRVIAHVVAALRGEEVDEVNRLATTAHKNVFC